MASQIWLWFPLHAGRFGKLDTAELSTVNPRAWSWTGRRVGL